MKKCKYCNEFKELGLFTKSKLCKDGYSHSCKICTRLALQSWYQKNKQKEKEDYVKNRKEKLQYQKDYVASNRHIKRNSDAKRRAIKLSAKPKWLTGDDLFAIKQFYYLAKLLESLTNLKYHVDHIVPLQGENVCGLHVPWNLQIITAQENLSKSNSFYN